MIMRFLLYVAGVLLLLLLLLLLPVCRIMTAELNTLSVTKYSYMVARFNSNYPPGVELSLYYLLIKCRYTQA